MLQRTDCFEVLPGSEAHQLIMDALAEGRLKITDCIIEGGSLVVTKLPPFRWPEEPTPRAEDER